jgi:hypothetical protein
MAFDIDGSMVLAFLDRTAMQGGWYNLGIDGGSTLYRSYSGGDILRAFYENGSYVLENNAKAGPATGAGANNNQGPGFGEFYADGRIGYHQEGALGGLALQPGSGQVLATTMDPGNYFTNGTTFFNNATGVGSNDYQVYQTANPNSNGTMSKASGLGDVDLMCGLPMYLEIGNYVWADADANGIQDPTEAGLSAVDVRLYSRTGTLVGLTTTSSTGEYYFNTSNVDTTGVNSSTGAANTAYTGMSANTRYYVVIGKSGTFSPANKVLTIASVGYTLTLPNNGQGANADANDSDASLASGVNAAFNGYPYISVLTGALGSVNHTYDFGFTNGTVGNYGWSDFNRNSINDDFPSGGAGINGLIIELWKETTPGSNSYALLRSTTTANDGSGNPGYYLFNVAETANYKVKFPTTYGSKVLTTQTATAGVDNNSDADIATGFSPAFAINVLSGGLAKDNMTIDAGFICPGGCATVTVLKN